MELGFVSNIVAKNVFLDRVNRPLHLYQTNNGHRYVACTFWIRMLSAIDSGDLPSQLTFANLQFLNWSGTAVTNESRSV